MTDEPAVLTEEQVARASAMKIAQDLIQSKAPLGVRGEVDDWALTRVAHYILTGQHDALDPAVTAVLTAPDSAGGPVGQYVRGVLSETTEDVAWPDEDNPGPPPGVEMPEPRGTQEAQGFIGQPVVKDRALAVVRDIPLDRPSTDDVAMCCGEGEACGRDFCTGYPATEPDDVADIVSMPCKEGCVTDNCDGRNCYVPDRRQELPGRIDLCDVDCITKDCDGTRCVTRGDV